MCGIAGFIDFRRQMASDVLSATVTRMADSLLLRGPDAGGIWVDAASGVALGHRRLSILDLTPTGSQPMLSANERYVLTYNGEVYNFAAIRAELESLGCRFRGSSDTEVLLEGFSQWGVEPALRKMIGMFSFALWDKTEKLLYLGRDRMGEKPLYYGWMDGNFLFGSELKSLRQHPNWKEQIDRDSITLLLRYNCIPDPFSIYQNVKKLLPGSYLVVPGGQATLPLQPIRYWHLREVAEQGARNPMICSETEAMESLEGILKQVIQQQMVADVPVGAFLSGGIDSSLIVGLMQSQSSVPVKTFTIGFEEDEFDEGRHARNVARYLGTEHTELYLKSSEAMRMLPRIPEIFDEPFSDSSQIPTFIVAQLARKSVTISLSGDGGDEVFAGYNRHYWAEVLWKQLRFFPRPLRILLARLLGPVSPRKWNQVLRGLHRLFPGFPGQNLAVDKIYKIIELLDSDSPETLYLRLVSHWQHPERAVIGATEPLTLATDRGHDPQFPSFRDWMQYMDSVCYLPNDILTKLDRATMAVSLESRVPFLDSRVVEFAWRLPGSMKSQGKTGKWLLRRLLNKYVPSELVDRPKAGFGVPIGEWLRGPLRDWAEALLNEDRLKREGYFNVPVVRKSWNEHISGRHDWQYHIWDVLMFQAWLETRTSPGIVESAVIPRLS